MQLKHHFVPKLNHFKHGMYRGRQKTTALTRFTFSYLERHISFTENALGISLVSFLLLFRFHQEPVLCLDHLRQHLEEKISFIPFDKTWNLTPGGEEIFFFLTKPGKPRGSLAAFASRPFELEEGEI